MHDVFLPVMPIGVEHGVVGNYGVLRLVVFLPVMPIGVEHKLSFFAILSSPWCVLTCDADRR